MEPTLLPTSAAAQRTPLQRDNEADLGSRRRGRMATDAAAQQQHLSRSDANGPLLRRGLPKAPDIELEATLGSALRPIASCSLRFAPWQGACAPARGDHEMAGAGGHLGAQALVAAAAAPAAGGLRGALLSDATASCCAAGSFWSLLSLTMGSSLGARCSPPAAAGIASERPPHATARSQRPQPQP